MNPNQKSEVQVMQPPGPTLVGAQYGQPVVQPGVVVPSAIIINQKTPEMKIAPEEFKTVPITMEWQFCKRMMTTKVNKSLDICACLLCYSTGIIFKISKLKKFEKILKIIKIPLSAKKIKFSLENKNNNQS